MNKSHTFLFAIAILLLIVTASAHAVTSTIDLRLVPQRQEVQPTTGQTVTVQSSGTVKLFINPAGTLVALTIALPSSPSDLDSVNISSSQAITGLTMSGGTIVGPLTTMAIGTFATYTFSATTNQWWRSA